MGDGVLGATPRPREEGARRSKVSRGRESGELQHQSFFLG